LHVVSRKQRLYSVYMDSLYSLLKQKAATALAAVALIAHQGAAAGAFSRPLSLNTASPENDKTLVYCSEGSPAGFDVAQYASSTDYTAAGGTIYNTLVQFERGGMTLRPALAERWDISPDGRVYTFYLRRGVKFHTTPWFTPSRAFNAEDVVFTFERMRNPDMPFRKAYPTEFPDWEFFGFDKIEKVEAVGSAPSYTVRFTLKDISAPFLESLAVPMVSIYSAEYADQLLKAGKAPEINQKPVGTGPFIFEQYVKDATIRFKANPDYWKPEDVQLSHLIFAITPDTKVRVQKIKKNECQAMIAPPLDSIDALKANPLLQVIGGKGKDFALNFLQYNVKHPPLGDVRVRRALDMVIDKKAIIKSVYFGHAQTAVAPLPPPQWSYDKSLKDAPRDFKEAKALLAQAGYPNGFSIALWAPSIARPYNPNSRLTAEIIQSDWKKIGVNAKIVSYEWAEFLKRAFHSEHDAVLMGGSGINDPDNWLGGFLGCRSMRGGNFSQWCDHDQPFDDLLQQAMRTLDREKRTALYLQAQKNFKDQQPYTALAYPINYYVLNKNVTDFKTYMFGTTVFYGVGLKQSRHPINR
jgi:dipeptide transport system substrate-binding protein